MSLKIIILIKYFNKTRITFVLINITRTHKDEKKKNTRKMIGFRLIT